MKNEHGLYNSDIIIEVLSVRGLQFENHTYLRNLKLHVIFDNQALQSQEIDFTTGAEVIIDFKASFKIMSNTMELKQDSRPIFIFISQSLSHLTTDDHNHAVHLLDHQPVGVTFSRTLLAEAVIDSRLAFLHTHEYLSVELVPCNCGGIIDVGFCGVIFMKLSLSGPLSQWISSMNIDDESKLNDINVMKLNIEKNQKAIERLNYEQYQLIKTWYSKCRASHPFIEDRCIKLIALDECGRHRMVCNFIGRITPPRSMDGPRYAARFVSLLPFYRSLELIGGNISSWNSSYITLTKLQGDIVDHAILLCSLLLGWGMDAWVAYGSIVTPVSTVGTSPSTNAGSGVDMTIPTNHFHYWVVTLDGLKSTTTTTAATNTTTSTNASSKMNSTSDDYVIFWEPLTGQQYKIPVNNKASHHTVMRQSTPSATTTTTSSSTKHSKKYGNLDRNSNSSSTSTTTAITDTMNHHPFRFIYSLFRHDWYLINLQPSPNVSNSNSNDTVSNSTPMASFDIYNDKFWSRLSNPHYNALKHPGASIPLPYHIEDAIYNHHSSSTVGVTNLSPSSVASPVVVGVSDGNHNNNKPSISHHHHHSSCIPYIKAVCTSDIEVNIEMAIRRECITLRGDKGLQTIFDDNLSIILQVRRNGGQ